MWPYGRIYISIHAPLTGSDLSRETLKPQDLDFNPRSPYGERPLRRQISVTRSNFNPRSPYGERPECVGEGAFDAQFQSTLPLRGATQPRELTGERKTISIHAPLTGSDALRTRDRQVGKISIHAPLTGSDILPYPVSSKIRYFNPRSPYGERRLASLSSIMLSSISIHAPLTGSDSSG